MDTDKKRYAERPRWEDYSGDYGGHGDCVMALHAVDAFANDRFEYVAVRRDGDGLGCVHGLVDLRDYLDVPSGPAKLDEIFQEDGYGCFDDFVLEGEDRGHGLVYDEKGRIDRADSPNYVVDMWLTAAHVAAHAARHAGPTAIAMAEGDAAEWLSARTYGAMGRDAIEALMGQTDGNG